MKLKKRFQLPGNTAPAHGFDATTYFLSVTRGADGVRGHAT